MPKIAIVGSCITRDLWPIRGGGSEQLLYVSRTSLASLLASPLPDFQPARSPPGDLHAHEHKALVADLEKTALARLVAFQPTHLIFDFIDERFDLISTRGTLVTHSAELVRSGYLSRAPFRSWRPISRLSAPCDRLWRDATRAFATLLEQSELRRAAPILHSARWATRQRDTSGAISEIRDVEILSGRPTEIGPYNALLERQEAEFLRLMSPMARIDADAFRLADPDHQWGLSPFHYIPEYYDEVRRQLGLLGLSGAFSEQPAAPSAPVA